MRSVGRELWSKGRSRARWRSISRWNRGRRWKPSPNWRRVYELKRKSSAFGSAIGDTGRDTWNRSPHQILHRSHRFRPRLWILSIPPTCRQFNQQVLIITKITKYEHCTQISFTCSWIVSECPGLASAECPGLASAERPGLDCLVWHSQQKGGAGRIAQGCSGETLCDGTQAVTGDHRLVGRFSADESGSSAHLVRQPTLQGKTIEKVYHFNDAHETNSTVSFTSFEERRHCGWNSRDVSICQWK